MLAMSLRRSEESSSSSPDGLRRAWNPIWKCNIPQKVKIFAWKAGSNCLPTMVNKKKRNLELSDVCSICGIEPEDVGHALYRCQHARNFWDAMDDTGRLLYSGAPPSNILDRLAKIQPDDRPTVLMSLW